MCFCVVNGSVALQTPEFSLVEVAVDPVVEPRERSWLLGEGSGLLFFAFSKHGAVQAR